jgi:hypothetical protein
MALVADFQAQRILLSGRFQLKLLSARAFDIYYICGGMYIVFHFFTSIDLFLALLSN